MKEFGNAIRELRRRSGLNMGDIAEILGCSVSHVSAVERGLKSPFTPDQIENLCRRLNADSSELLRVARSCPEVVVTTNDHPRHVVDVVSEILAAFREGRFDEATANRVRHVLSQ